jgi:hypothetical protein
MRRRCFMAHTSSKRLVCCADQLSPPPNSDIGPAEEPPANALISGSAADKKMDSEPGQVGSIRLRGGAPAGMILLRPTSGMLRRDHGLDQADHLSCSLR